MLLPLLFANALLWNASVLGIQILRTYQTLLIDFEVVDSEVADSEVVDFDEVDFDEDLRFEEEEEDEDDLERGFGSATSSTGSKRALCSTNT